MRTRHRLVCSILALLFVQWGWTAQVAAQRRPDDDDIAVAKVADLPTGMRITPDAAPGARFTALSPNLPGMPNFSVGQAVGTAVGPDGRTLLILTSGYNVQYDASGALAPHESNEYVFVYDIAAQPPRKIQVLQVPTAFNGLAWNPSGKEFYVSGGEQDTVHVFARDGAAWREAGAPLRLGHAAGLGLGIRPEVAGIGVSAGGTRLIAANYENDSISVVDLGARSKIAELDLRPGKNDPSKKGIAGGEYPFWVAVKGDEKAYVSSIRDREIVVVALGVDRGGGARIANRIPVRGTPNKMILNRGGSRLYVACDNSDSVAIVDTESDRLITQFAVTAPKDVFLNPRGFRGSNPNSLALSPDERTLYVTEGGTNALAVVKLDGDTGRVAGLIPVGWYPNSVSVSADGARLYIVNGKSPEGPNPTGCGYTPSPAACHAKNAFIFQRSRAGFLTLPVPTEKQLVDLTEQVARNDHFRTVGAREQATMQFLRGRIHHVVYIIKENRSYDQVLGDLERGNGDPTLTLFPERVSPNHHELARQFVTLDNFYASGEVSGDGWNWSTAARATDSVEKTVPVEYAGHGLDYNYEGGGRNINTGLATVADRQRANPLTPADEDLLPGTASVSAPDAAGDAENAAGAGYLWDGARRAKLTLRNYGFFIDLLRYRLPEVAPGYLAPVRDARAMGTPVAFSSNAELAAFTDPYYRGFDERLPDYWRFKEWEHEFDDYVRERNLPALELLRLGGDHFGDFAGAMDGVNTVETQMAANDYALGLVIEKIAHSPYKNDTLVFVVEDDAQDGPDHVDAHRSLAFVAGPYVRRRALVSERYTSVHVLRAIEDVLGIEPLGLNDSSVEPMTAVFDRVLRAWDYRAIVPAILRTTQLPLPADSAAGLNSTNEDETRPHRDAAYWAAKTEGMDFSAEDRLDTARFNRVLWTGLMGDAVPFPESPKPGDFRRHRTRLLRDFSRRTPGGNSAHAGSEIEKFHTSSRRRVKRSL
jgi:DNA-binding beta-propeller fold protein YncE